jgi:4-hydroxybenzoyl-CoA reductase subunit beta
MIYFDFDYERAATLEEAVALLGSLEGEARALAGGTDLLPSMRMENVRPGLLVSLGAIEPAPPEILPDGSLRIDALSRLATLENSRLVAERAPMITRSAHVVGGNQIRQMGTLGGNLCQEIRCLYLDQRHDYQFVAPCYKRGGECCYPFPRNAADTCWSVHMSDVAPALIALDATLDVAGGGGSRAMPVAELFSGNGLAPLRLAEAELVRAVSVPAAGTRAGWAYHKATVRGGLEFGMAVIATVLRLKDDLRTCREARVVVGAVREGPVRLASVEGALAGAVPDEALLEKIAAAGARETNPLPHHGASRRHLLDVVRVQLKRALVQALGRARQA